MYRCEDCRKTFNTPKYAVVINDSTHNGDDVKMCPHCKSLDITMIQKYKQKYLF